MGAWHRKGRRRICRVLCGLAAMMATVRLAPAGELQSPGCLAGSETATVVSVSDTQELTLADGRKVTLPGIDAIRATEAAPKGAQAAQATLDAWLAGRSVRLNVRAAEPDRWGRVPALVFADRPGAPIASGGGESLRVSVGEALIDAGLARARPDPAVASCWQVYQALEARARAGRTGLWADPSFAMTSASDARRLSLQTGAMAIVEGQVMAIRIGRSRTYLAFDARNRAGFTIAVERRVALGLAKGGTDLATWVGRHVRVRGFLDDRFGMQIDLTSLDQVEFIDP